jgi:aminoglycoside 6'-N-acetyltransferase
VGFRRLVAGDLPRLHRWLQDPGVVRWWEGDDVSWAGVRRTYGATADDPEEHYTALLDELPVGWIQWVRLADVPGDAAFFAPLNPGPESASIDYLLGEHRWRGRGVGTAMIRAFVHRIVLAGHPEVSEIWVAPQLANEASWRALAAAGFRHVADLPDPVGTCRAMVLRRPDVL